MTAGQILSVRRYPVKSMRGEAIEAGSVSARGLDGDRCLALVDRADGKVASAKNPGKWAVLLQCAAAYVGPVDGSGGLPSVAVTLADGSTVTSGDDDIDTVLSRAVGRPVTLTGSVPASPTLERMTPGVEGLEPDGPPPGTVRDGALGAGAPGETFFDYAPIHLVTTATLRGLSAVHPGAGVTPQRLRPNLVVDVEDEGFVENEWVGARLRIGSEVVLDVVTATPRCIVPTLSQPGMSTDVEVLRAITKANRVEIAGRGRFGCAGVYATVARGGRVRRGDPVVLT